MVVILHNIRSTHNVGSIFRTADAAGCEKIYLCGITPTPTDRFGRANEKIAKVALGAENWVKWEKISRTTAILDKLKKEGYKIFAIEQSKKSIPYNKLKIKNFKVALILGAEVDGLPPAVLRRADKILEIPMRGKKESLNVVVAFGIVVFNLTNK
ncbi:TrmH family RNA methyltransferase [Patescibacteria group bacterium]|nr:TrmH family RNA methyltransferase [Patescibacteria group bacterium]